mmetsp:Transcript_42519/g.83595  ORF Transcript_42519/g.83595 Transcript_42519/m.83595 type:complete len:270 (+) Transcript_42519:227-1036(+)|eukprot:CAMPEP_0194309306 /NCGR_PEP_ID=MMETSP0171-20130528/6287_1 /TAXON_ID=218684 /ORGANISM="Corethron pennatum, Strain L29A3" /LENGTH=269 /DNA_ID=CAMNT_0039062425 /DNA_START=167 /DNA_END=976 /DNA_ORIENTATION=+
MSSYSSAARTNLTSQSVHITGNKLGEGAFRVAYEGIYKGGNRNQQEAACKCFKSIFRGLENEFFADDFRVADKAIDIAEDWNSIVEEDEKILMTKGDVMKKNGIKYLVEPFIRYWTKYTSNNGWICSNEGWQGQAMEAFSHYSYHRTGGSLIVCDLQGRYRHDARKMKKCRFELTDPAICSRRRSFGPTDLGEKGIHSFFANHRCNHFCNIGGTRWQRPRDAQQWFPVSEGTSMISSLLSGKLALQSSAKFKLGQMDMIEEDFDSDSDY